MSGLWGGYVVSNVLKWYWWRLNGYGYFYGMVAGIIGAMTFPLIFADTFDVAVAILPLYLFPLLLVVSALGCVLGSLLTPPENEELLKTFYRQVRPWGFWGPIKKLVMEDDPQFVPNQNFKRDMFNVSLGISAQTCLVALPIFIVIKDFNSAIVTFVILTIAALGLKRFWYNTLEN